MESDGSPKHVLHQCPNCYFVNTDGLSTCPVCNSSLIGTGSGSIPKRSGRDSLDDWETQSDASDFWGSEHNRNLPAALMIVAILLCAFLIFIAVSSEGKFIPFVVTLAAMIMCIADVVLMYMGFGTYVIIGLAAAPTILMFWLLGMYIGAPPIGIAVILAFGIFVMAVLWSDKVIGSNESS